MLEKRIRVSPSVSLKCVLFPPWNRSNWCTLSRSYSNYSWTLECPVSDIQLQTFPCTERTMSFRQIKVDNFPAAINVYLSIFTWEQPVQTAQSPVPDKSWHRPLHPFSGKETAHDKIDDSLINITRASRCCDIRLWLCIRDPTGSATLTIIYAGSWSLLESSGIEDSAKWLWKFCRGNHTIRSTISRASSYFCAITAWLTWQRCSLCEHFYKGQAVQYSPTEWNVLRRHWRQTED